LEESRIKCFSVKFRLRMGAPTLLLLLCVVILGCQSGTYPLWPRATAKSIEFPPSSPDKRQELVSKKWILKNVTVIDGTGATPLAGQDILISDGKIEAVKPSATAPDVPFLDGTGMMVIPGLIDCHTHTQSVPEAQWAPGRGNANQRLSS
jgi:hypothetical protein